MPKGRTLSQSAWRRRVLELATFLAEEALANDLFARFLAMLARDFPGSSGVLDYNAQEQRTEFVTWEVDSSAKNAYNSHFHAINPFREAILKQRLYNVTFIGSRRVDSRALMKSEFYNDWMRPQGDRYFMAMSIRFPDGGRTGIPIYRAEREDADWTSEDVRRLEMLRPFLTNTVLLRRLWHQHQKAELPIVRFNEGAVDACNDAGDSYLRTREPNSTPEFVPLDPVSSQMCFVRPAVECDARTIFARRYGLSKRESDIAALLTDGLSYKEIADRLCISFHTVNSHVKSLLRKLNLSSTRRLGALLRTAG